MEEILGYGCLLVIAYALLIPGISLLLFNFQGLFYGISALLIIVSIVNFIWSGKLKLTANKLKAISQNLKDKWRD